MKPIDPEALRAAGFTEEPAPEILTLRCEKARNQPPCLEELGQVRVRFRTRWGGWFYVEVPTGAVITPQSD